jgi:hypothetical protein
MNCYCSWVRAATSFKNDCLRFDIVFRALSIDSFRFEERRTEGSVGGSSTTVGLGGPIATRLLRTTLRFDLLKVDKFLDDSDSQSLTDSVTGKVMNCFSVV